jgi:molybdopterin-guanine dinucleotide biosynthesis protein A
MPLCTLPYPVSQVALMICVLEHVTFINIHAACSNIFGGANSSRLFESNQTERALGLSGKSGMSVEAVKRNKVIGCILCGGKSRRMGGTDKALLDLNGTALLEHVASRLHGQVVQSVLSVNEPSGLHESLGLPMLTDELEGHLGPLAGVHSSLNWVRQNTPDVSDVVTVAVDTPFFPTDLVETLAASRIANAGAPIICSSGGRHHFAFGLWPVALADPLKEYLLEGGRSIKGFFKDYPPVIVEFELQNAVDPFFNINTPEDIPVALEHIAQLQVQ